MDQDPGARDICSRPGHPDFHRPSTARDRLRWISWFWEPSRDKSGEMMLSSSAETGSSGRPVRGISVATRDPQKGWTSDQNNWHVGNRVEPDEVVVIETSENQDCGDLCSCPFSAGGAGNDDEASSPANQRQPFSPYDEVASTKDIKTSASKLPDHLVSTSTATE